MLKRVLTGAVILVLAIGAVLLRQVTVYSFDAFVAIIVGFSLYEVVKSLKAGGLNVNPAVPAVYFVAYLPLYLLMGWTGIAFAVLLAVVVALTCFTFSERQSLTDLLASVFTVIYPGVFLTAFSVINHGYLGITGIIFVFAVSMLTDTMAYFVGVLLGRHKLCPKISPKKTVEGLIGGLLGGIGGAALAYWLGGLAFGPVAPIPGIDQWLFYAIAGLLGAVVNTVGDLIASRIKRAVGIKDFGTVFPGHGGFMDRMDGLSCVALVLAIALEVIL